MSAPLDLPALAVAALVADCGGLGESVPIDAAHVAARLGMTEREVETRLRALVFLRVLRVSVFGPRTEYRITEPGAQVLADVIRPLASLLLPPRVSAQAYVVAA